MSLLSISPGSSHSFTELLSKESLSRPTKSCHLLNQQRLITYHILPSEIYSHCIFLVKSRYLFFSFYFHKRIGLFSVSSSGFKIRVFIESLPDLDDFCRLSFFIFSAASPG
jgi:hypothetical protein